LSSPEKDLKASPWRYAALGTQLAVSILLGIGAGYWADRRFGTQPWGLLIGAALGALIGFYQFFVETLGAGKPPAGG